MDVEKRIAGLEERVLLAEHRAAASEALCTVLVSYLSDDAKGRLRGRRDAMRRRLDAERPKRGHAFVEDRFRALNLLDELLLVGLTGDTEAPLDIV